MAVRPNSTRKGSFMKRFAGHHDPLSPGDTVLLTDRKDRRFMFELKPGGAFHFHRGIIDHD